MRLTLVLQNNNKTNNIYDSYPNDLLSTHIDVMEKQIVHFKYENKIFQESLHELYKKTECGELDINSIEFKQAKEEIFDRLYQNLLSIPRHENNLEGIYDWLDNYLNDDDQTDDIDLNIDEDGNYISDPNVYYTKNP